MLAFFKALPPCLIGMEACATAHYWARELKAYVMRNKNDAADAEAICEAVQRLPGEVVSSVVLPRIGVRS